MFISVTAFWWKDKEAVQLCDTDADVYFGEVHYMDQHCFPHTQFNLSYENYIKLFIGEILTDV